MPLFIFPWHCLQVESHFSALLIFHGAALEINVAKCLFFHKFVKITGINTRITYRDLSSSINSSSHSVHNESSKISK